MKQYILSDRDFEEFYALMQKIETENNLKHGHPIRTHNCPQCDLQAQYRYYFIGWRNRVVNGDSYFHYPDPPREDTAAVIRREVERLQKLLPKG